MKFSGEVFVTLLVIMDPAATVSLFIALTRGREPGDCTGWLVLRCWPARARRRHHAVVQRIHNGAQVALALGAVIVVL